MRLNKYQKAWIEKLMSGTTRKAKGQLAKSNRQCCLGVAVKVCDLEKLSDVAYNVSLAYCVSTRNAIKIDNFGSINLDKVKPKWKKLIQEESFSELNLACLNDETKWSHVKIGQFINENREAVFHEST